jgi:hypothetical protein
VFKVILSGGASAPDTPLPAAPTGEYKSLNGSIFLTSMLNLMAAEK